MLVVAVAALILQQTPGAVVWNPSPPPEPVVEAAPVETAPALPDWAIADPFAWERAQCSSLVRGAVSLNDCQARARSDLSAQLGPALPEALRPTGSGGNCVPTPGDRYAVTCAPPPRKVGVNKAPEERICENTPRRLENGAMTWEQQCCGTNTPPGEREGLTLRLFGQD